jgi:4-amino-4-deoxy-L-arabinose transferase-like glycosyltransferase
MGEAQRCRMPAVDGVRMTSQLTIDTAQRRGHPAPQFEDLSPIELPPGAEEQGADAPTPRWARLSQLALLLATAGTYLYNLAASGFGNTFYAAAVEAGSKSWKAMLFGSLDPSNFITVDKPPASLWVMDLSARIFGFSTWSVMVPGVLEGVAAVALLYGAVRRVSNPACGLIAGGILATTPVAALMFRFDNPDALLVLLLVGAAYCMTRAIEKAGTRWMVAVGAVLGFAFLTKMMQAFTVVPAFGLVYLIAAPTTLRRRIGQLLAALASLVIAAGWWVAIVALTPVADRPFIDGSPDNSIWNLIFVYNGFGRLSGSGSGNGANFSGTAGVFRLFNDLMGGQASWLLPAALVAIVAVLVARRYTPRTDPIRAAAIIWGGWLLVTGAVFSYGKGVIHTYYTVALAPAIAALVAVGAHELWKQRNEVWARLVTALAITGTAAWAWALLDRTPSWNPALRWIVVVAAVAAAGLTLTAPSWRRNGRIGRGLSVALAGLVGVAFLTGPVAYAAATVATAHTGSIPSAGPTSAEALGGGPGSQIGGGGSPGGARSGAGGGFGGTTAPSGMPSISGGKHPSGGANETAPTAAGAAKSGTGSTTRPSGGRTAMIGESSAVPGGGTAGAGAGVTASAALVKALEADASAYKWVAAVEGSQSAASLELATSGDAVMAIGGFNNEGGDLSLAAFKAYVAQGDIHYYIGGSSGGGMPGAMGVGNSAIATWVKAHFKAVTIGGQTVYDLTARASR